MVHTGGQLIAFIGGLASRDNGLSSVLASLSCVGGASETFGVAASQYAWGLLRSLIRPNRLGHETNKDHGQPSWS